MSLRRLAVACFFASVAALPASAQQGGAGSMNKTEKGGSDDTGPYTPVENWWKPVKEGFVEKGSAVFAESPDRIFFTTSNEFPTPRGRGGPGGAGGPAPAGAQNMPRVMILDRTGKVVDEWTQWESIINMPHFVTESPYDPAPRPVWIVSRETDQIFKFSNDGKQLLMTLGVARDKMPKDDQGRPTTLQDATHFGRPSAIAFLPDGSFYVADGYTNRRVAKFDKNGKFLFEFGSVGSGPGQFAAQGEVHGIAIDNQHHIYIGDRGNKRVQVFDENGKYLDEWDHIQGPSDIHIMADGTAWVVSGVGNRLIKFDTKTGKRLDYWGMYGTFAGAFDDPHFISVDSEGNLYVAIFSNNKIGVEKYVPKPGVDKARLIGPNLIVK